MSEWPRNGDYNRIVISPASPESIGAELAVQLTTAGSAVWNTANTALFIPFTIYRPYIAVKMGVVVGTVNGGNCDVGIYDEAANRIVSTGSTAYNGTVSTVMSFDITDTTLRPGNYFMALTIDNGTSTVSRWTSSIVGTAGAFGVYSQATALPLPATATFALSTGGFIPQMFVTGRTAI